jgi:hypothetical protein
MTDPENVLDNTRHPHRMDPRVPDPDGDALARGDFDGALSQIRDLDPSMPPAERSWLEAEILERWGDSLWFHDRPGAPEHYRAAMEALLPRQSPFVPSPEEAQLRQAAWSRVAEKVLYGTGPDGLRRPGAPGTPHPAGTPPHPPPPVPEPPAPVAVAVARRAEGPSTASSGSPGDPPTGQADPIPDPGSPPPPPTDPRDRGHLIFGRSYRVAKTFRDFDGGTWVEGTVFVYEGYHFFPYDDGLTLFTDRGNIRLSGLFPENQQVRDAIEEYLIPV